jgi:hypothetical protein
MPTARDAPDRIVLLPGMDGTGLLFEPLVEVLSEFDPVIVSYPPEAIAAIRRFLASFDDRARGA